MVTYFVLKNMKGRYLGSALAKSNSRIKSAYGWGVQFRENSLKNLIVEYFGVLHLGARMRNRILGDILKGKKHSDHSIFDAGCGVGLTSIFLSKEFSKVYGVDADPLKIKEAKTLASDNHIKNVVFKRMDLLKDNILNKKFNYVVCLEVIEHISDDKKLIYNLSKLIKKKGFLVLSFPAKTLISRIGQESQGHVRVGYSPDDIRMLLPKTNLKIVDVLSLGNNILGKTVIICDFFLRKTIPPLGSIFFPIFYPLLILDYHLPVFTKPRGYIVVIQKTK